MVNLHIALRLPRDARSVSVARRVAAAALEQLGVTSECVEDIRLILSEACSNVVRHAASADDYEIRLAIRDNWCTIRVIDAGHEIDLSRIEQGMPDAASAEGRGLPLIRSLTD